MAVIGDMREMVSLYYYVVYVKTLTVTDFALSMPWIAIRLNIELLLLYCPHLICCLLIVTFIV